MNGADLLLKNFLVDTGVLSRSQVESALRERAGKPFAQAVLESGIIAEDELRRASAHALGIPFVTLGRDDITVASLVLIPEPLSRTSNIVAYRHGEEGIEVALLDIADLDKIDFLRQTHRVQVRLTDRGSVKQALVLYQKHLKEKFTGLVQNSKEAADSLLRHALHSGAHYIHIEPSHAEAAGVVVRYRIEGLLREALRLPDEAARYIIEQLKSLSKLFPVTTTAQEGSFTFMHDGEEVGVSVNTAPTVRGEKISMRLTRTQTAVTGFSLQSLGLHGPALERVHDALNRKKGAVLVAGMDGSGKTTMLYTMLEHITGAHMSVATVETNVEYRLPRVQQTMTRPDLGLTVPAALRAVLKQDPDAVMISELNTDDASQLAIHAAERGIFILGGVQARSAKGALEILETEASVDPVALSGTVQLVVAQKLLRRLRPQAATRALTRSEAELLESKVRFAKVLAALKEEGVVHEYVAWKDILFYSGIEVGVYEGLAGIQEVLVNTSATKVNADSLTLLEDALFKAVQGLVSIEDVVEMAGE